MRALHALLAAVVVTAGLGGLVGPATTAPTSTPTASEGGTPVATPAVDAPPTAPTDVRSPPPAGTVEVLALRRDASNRSTVRGVGVDLGPAVAFDTNATTYRLGTIRAVDRVETADDAGRALRTEIDRIEDRADALGRAQRGALRAYVAGEASARRTLIRLARIHTEAGALDRRLDRLVDLAEREGVDLGDDRLAALAVELDVYTGPVRNRVVSALTGRRDATRVYLAATPRGVTLATISRGVYLRETYRGDRRRVGGTVAREAAYEVVEGAYPSLPDAGLRRTFAGADGHGVVDLAYDGGSLRAHVGGRNDRVFRDVHRQSLAVATTDRTAINTRDGLRMTVNRSYAGGAMRVLVTDAEGDPVNASVTVGPEGGESTSVGQTGADGVVWTLTPNQRFTVVAIRDQSVVFLTMDPLATPRADEPAGA